MINFLDHCVRIILVAKIQIVVAMGHVTKSPNSAIVRMDTKLQ